jgi:hypothetical protein
VGVGLGVGVAVGVGEGVTVGDGTIVGVTLGVGVGPNSSAARGSVQADRSNAKMKSASSLIGFIGFPIVTCIT